MKIIEIKTLVDITDTKAVRPGQGSSTEQGQYKNFITLKQCVELRSNIFYETGVTEEIIDLKDLGFGSKFKGKHKVWTFKFSPEFTGAYQEDDNEIGTLLTDLHEIPIIKKLTETINIDKAVFDVKNADYKNTIIKALQGTI